MRRKPAWILTMSDPKLLFNWRWAIASADGPASPTTRHVLLTLSVHMGLAGDRAHPSEACLAKETGLSERAVGIHLQKAVDAGWITRKPRREGRDWAQYHYQAVIPAHLRGPERRSGLGTEPHARGPERDDTEVPNDVRTNTTRTSTKNTRTYLKFVLGASKCKRAPRIRGNSPRSIPSG